VECKGTEKAEEKTTKTTIWSGSRSVLGDHPDFLLGSGTPADLDQHRHHDTRCAADCDGPCHMPTTEQPPLAQLPVIVIQPLIVRIGPHGGTQYLFANLHVHK